MRCHKQDRKKIELDRKKTELDTEKTKWAPSCRGGRLVFADFYSDPTLPGKRRVPFFASLCRRVPYPQGRHF